jgi:hypothetical protein
LSGSKAINPYRCAGTPGESLTKGGIVDDKQWNEFRLQDFITQREGMIAENLDRYQRGFAVAYKEAEFAKLADEIRAFAAKR